MDSRIVRRHVLSGLFAVLLASSACGGETAGRCTDPGATCLAGEVCEPDSGECVAACSGTCADPSRECDPATGLCVACVNDPAEPNDVPSEAEDLDLAAGAALAEGRRICLGDVDWFAVDLAEGDAVQADVIFAGGEGAINVALQGPAPTDLLASGVASETGATVSGSAPAAGTYWIRVAGAPSTTRTAYDLRVARGAACADDALEPNDNAAGAVAATAGTTADLRICPGDEDWFAVDLAGGQTITVSLAFQHLRGDLNLQIVGTDGATVIRESVSTTDGETILHPIGTTGIYYVRVYGVGVWVENDYDLMISISEGCTDDALEPNSSPAAAASVVVPFEHDDLTICYGDEDWLAFDADLGQTVTLLARFSHAAGDLQLDIFDPDGVTLLARAASATDDESLIFMPSTTGRYLIRVYGRTPAEMNGYNLMATVTGTPCESDRNEPNDSLLLATPMDSAATTALSICPGDYDYFAVDAEAGQTIVAEARFAHADGDLHLRLYDTDGLTILAQSATAGDIERVVYPVLGGGSYFVLVWGANFFQTNAYDLVIEVRGTECPPDAQEPNNSFLDAGLLVSGTTVSGEVCYGDWDYFAVDLEMGQVVAAEARFTHAGGNLQMVFYDVDGRTWLAGSAGSSDTETVVYLPTAPGRYYVAVYGYSFMTRNTYVLEATISGEACVNDAGEPNNSFVSATPAAAGSYAGQICYGDRDLYAVTLAAGQTLSAIASFTHAEGNLQMRLIDVDGVTALAYSTGSSDTETIVFVATTDGQYFLDVYGFSFTTQNDYTLDVEIAGTPCVPDANEPNNSYLLATPAAGASMAGEVCYGDWDWYSIAAESGQTINAVLRFTNASGNLDLRLYDQDGMVLLVSAATSNDVETISYPIAATGTYFVAVWGRTGMTRNTYTLELSVAGTPCTNDAREPNDSYLTASPTPAATVSGQICNGDWDWFLVDAAVGQTIDAVLRFTNADGNLDMRLYDVDGVTVLVYAATAGDTETISYRVTMPGTFYMAIYGRTGMTRNAYTLDLSLAGTACVNDGREPNNSASTASAIVPGTYSATICEGDRDVFAVDASVGQQIAVEARFTHAAGNLDMQLIDLDGATALVTSAGNVDNETILYYPTVTGRYFVAVYGRTGLTRNNYSLVLEIRGTPCTNDASEPNNSVLSATPVTAAVSPGTTVPSLQICNGDNDYFAVTLGVGERVRVTATFLHADGNLDLYFYDRDGMTLLVYSTGVVDNEQITYSITQAGTYYARVVGSTFSQRAPYSLNVMLL